MTIDGKLRKSYKTVWIILAISVLILIALLAYALTLLKQVMTSQSAVYNPQARLGELGAQCGGELRLPCKPGLNCVKNNPQDVTGVCTKVTDKEPGKVEPLGT